MKKNATKWSKADAIALSGLIVAIVGLVPPAFTWWRDYFSSRDDLQVAVASSTLESGRALHVQLQLRNAGSQAPTVRSMRPVIWYTPPPKEGPPEWSEYNLGYHPEESASFVMLAGQADLKTITADIGQSLEVEDPIHLSREMPGA